MARDRIVNRTLRRANWSLIRIWECDIAKRPGWCVGKLKKFLAKAQ
jgi:G:T-mismatch repair DNA endonuclease (very short patch repair protein)